MARTLTEAIVENLTKRILDVAIAKIELEKEGYIPEDKINDVLLLGDIALKAYNYTENMNNTQLDNLHRITNKLLVL